MLLVLGTMGYSTLHFVALSAWLLTTGESTCVCNPDDCCTVTLQCHSDDCCTTTCSAPGGPAMSPVQGPINMAAQNNDEIDDTNPLIEKDEDNEISFGMGSMIISVVVALLLGFCLGTFYSFEQCKHK